MTTCRQMEKLQEIVITMPRAKDKEEFDQLLKQANEEIGWSGKAYLFVGLPTDNTWHFLWHHKRLYRRYSDARFFYAVEGQGPTNLPDVLCPCGSVTFTLRYGSYEIKARCAKCGTEEDVYSG